MRIRTGYSFNTAIGHIEDAIERIKASGWKHAPITDRTSTFGFARWTKLAAANGLHPIYGVELAVVPKLGLPKPPIDYWTFIATDNLRSIHDLIAVATNNQGKEPQITYEQAEAAKGVIKIAGSRCLLEGISAQLCKEIYMALSPSLPRGLYREAISRKIRLIQSSDNVYPNATDLELYRIALDWRAGTQTYPQHILTDAEWREAMYWVDEKVLTRAIKTRNDLFKKCKATLKQAKLLTPEKKKTLRQLCVEGAKQKHVNLKVPEYRDRLDRELQLIDDKRFEDYFYILSDIIKWARDKMVVGPARGSSCGSLVCYLLDITTIDPIPFGLIFERFIDINRKDLPDIDVDFSDAKRSMVFEYVEQKFGKEHVARLGTVGLFKPKSALNTIANALDIPDWEIDKVSGSMLQRSSGDSRALNALEDTLKETENGRALVEKYPKVVMASKLEGMPHISSQHAAGVLITDEPITEFVAVDSSTGAAWCDKKDSETLNLLKIDALGLTQLSIFERTLELINKSPRFLDEIPLDDPAAFDILNKNQFSGIFQFTGVAMRSLATQITYDKLEDIIATTALARPGPLATGGASSWVLRRTGKEGVQTIHPMLTELTKDDYGVVIYQETVMKIVREMGQMSWEDTSAIRKAMSGSLGDEFFEKYKVKFLAGAAKNDVPQTIAEAIWKQINTFGSWAFNKSHAVAYGIVSYWCCWLKAHHPLEFAAATLDAEADAGKQIALLKELYDEGIRYVPVDPEFSDERWTIAHRPEGTTLVGPLTAIKGIGPKKMREIIDTRKVGNPLRPALLKQLENAKTEIDTLFPISDKIKELHPDLHAINIYTEATPIAEIKTGTEVLILAKARRVAPRDENDSAKVASRGGRRLGGPTMALNLFMVDDTGEIFCKVNRYKYEEIGKEIVNKARPGKSLYAIKGKVPDIDFKMISVDRVKYLGEIDEKPKPKQPETDEHIEG